MCYTIAACFPIEPLEKCMTFKDIFPGLSRTLSFNFEDFPEPKWFSRTFQVLEFSRKQIQDFPGLSRRCGNPASIFVDIFSFFLLRLLYCRAVPARRMPGTKHLTLMLMLLAFIIQITSELFQSIAILQCLDTEGQHEGHSVCKNVFQQAQRFSWRRPDLKWRKSQE